MSAFFSVLEFIFNPSFEVNDSLISQINSIYKGNTGFLIGRLQVCALLVGAQTGNHPLLHVGKAELHP